MDHATLRRIGCFIAGLLAAAAGVSGGADLSTLRVLGDAYPRAFFFRYSESLAAQPRVSYEQWEACVGRLMGIEVGHRRLARYHVQGGVDAVMFSNEFSRPYLTRVETVTVVLEEEVM